VSGLETTADEMEKAAAEVRKVWHVPAGPIQNVVSLLEAHGVVVIRLPLDSPDVDAFSLPFADYPVIVLGSDKNDRARSRFDASHELGHFVVHGDEVWGLPRWSGRPTSSLRLSSCRRRTSNESCQTQSIGVCCSN